MPAIENFGEQKSSPEGILGAETALIKAATRCGLNLKPTPASIKSHLSTLSERQLFSICESLLHLTRVLEVCSLEDISPWDEKAFFRLSLKELGLTAPPDFLDHVVEGDLIEGYDMNRYQVFRNLRFMESTSYSLTEILSHEWPMLFDRPGLITEKMISYCDEILWTSNKTIAFDVPLHAVRELKSVGRQVYEVRFKYLAPLFSGPNRPFGLLGTCQVKSVNPDIFIDKIHFI